MYIFVGHGRFYFKAVDTKKYFTYNYFWIRLYIWTIPNLHERRRGSLYGKTMMTEIDNVNTHYQSYSLNIMRCFIHLRTLIVIFYNFIARWIWIKTNITPLNMVFHSSTATSTCNSPSWSCMKQNYVQFLLGAYVNCSTSTWNQPHLKLHNKRHYWPNLIYIVYFINFKYYLRYFVH